MSAVKELQQWADRCLHWSKKARSDEQRATLVEWERFLRGAALEAADTELLDAFACHQPTVKQ